MKKLVLILLGALVLAGCASRQPMTFKGNAYERSEEQVRNAIITAAKNNQWNVCDAGNGALRADLTYKKYRIYADMLYSAEGFTVEPNLKYTTLVNKDGSVHKSINNLIKRLFKLANRQVGLPTTEKRIELERCINYDKLTYAEYGPILAAKGYVNAGFAWINKPEVLPKEAKFRVEVEEDKAIPAAIVNSTFERFTEYLTDRQWQGTDANSYLLKVNFVSYAQQSKGGVVDFMNLADSHNQFQVKVTVKDPKGQDVCLIDVSTRVDTSGFTGVINKSTSRVTATLADAVLENLDEMLLGNPKD